MLYIKDSIKMVALNLGEGKQTQGYIVVLNTQNKVKGYISNGNGIISLSDSLIIIETPFLNEDNVRFAPDGISIQRIDLCGCSSTNDNIVITDFKLIGSDSICFQYRYNKSKIFANRELGKYSIQKTHPDIDSTAMPIGSQLSFSYMEKRVYFYTFKNNCWYGKYALFVSNAKAELFFSTLFNHFINNTSIIDSSYLKFKF